MVATISNADGSTLGDNLITSHQATKIICPQCSFQLKLLKMTKNTLHLAAIR